MRRRLTALLLGTLCAFLCACQENRSAQGADNVVNSRPSKTGATVNGSTTFSAQATALLEEAHARATAALEPAAEAVSGVAKDEFDKLSRVEYRVAEIEKLASPEKHEAFLNALGQDGWECFHTESIEFALRFYCSRRPKGLLRFLGMTPRMF